MKDFTCPICEKEVKSFWAGRWYMVVIHTDGTKCEKGKKVDEPTGIFDEPAKAAAGSP
jgi:RNA polymerase subunit RPABC4/transcription elongation factor Spt4